MNALFMIFRTHCVDLIPHTSKNGISGIREAMTQMAKTAIRFRKKFGNVYVMSLG